MRKHYGFPYKGSKDKIAEAIVEVLPAGRRLVDLFGGGGAISVCALESGKWQSVLFNDISPLNGKLISEAIAGKYNYNVFKPEFISREKFFELKDTDGYVKYIWSFGNDGASYMFGAEIEPLKHAAHDYIVFGEWSELLKPWKDCGIYPLETPASDIAGRQFEWSSKIRKVGRQRFELQQLERLQRLQQLQQLQQLQRLQQLEQLERPQQLEISSLDYRDYEYQEGDVVYCDIPYPNSKQHTDYGTGFDFGIFANWAVLRPYPIYFSSYELGKEVWRQRKAVTLAANSVSHRTECVYCIGG